MAQSLPTQSDLSLPYQSHPGRITPAPNALFYDESQFVNAPPNGSFVIRHNAGSGAQNGPMYDVIPGANRKWGDRRPQCVYMEAYN